MNRHRTYLLLAVLALALVGGAVAAFFFVVPHGKEVAVPGDMVGCVYGSANSGSEFKKSLPPGTSATVDSGDQLVLLPTNDQIYNMTTSDNRTNLAPSRVLAFTKGQTAVWVEGVLKFRLNTNGDKACRFYSKYGLQGSQYGDFGFSAAAGEKATSPTHTGWFRFLAQAHGETMQQVVHDGSSAWTWQQLAYGSDPAVSAKPTPEPVSISYGKHIGAMFSKYLQLNLGDRYFCGVQPLLTGEGGTPGCPPIYFQILSVYPRDESLAAEHDKLKQLDAQLQRQRQAAKLKAMNRAVAIASAKAQRKVLLQQIVNTRLDAQNDVKIQKCLILARVGLDCDGKKQQIIVAGVPSASGK